MQIIVTRCMRLGRMVIGLGLAGLVTGCASRELTVSATDRLYSPPAKPAAAAGPGVEGQAGPAGGGMPSPEERVAGRSGLEPGEAPALTPPGAAAMEGGKPETPTAGAGPGEEVRVAETPVAGAPVAETPTAAPPETPGGLGVPRETGPAAGPGPLPEAPGRGPVPGRPGERGGLSAAPGPPPEGGGAPQAGAGPEQAGAARRVGESPLADAFFDYDQWVIRKDAQAALEGDSAYLRGLAGRPIVLEGYCDERGTSDYNLVLGEKRARAALRYLQDLGVDAARMRITSFGKEKPFCLDHTVACWQENRRAHVVAR